jgi:hypothetical protein
MVWHFSQFCVRPQLRACVNTLLRTRRCGMNTSLLSEIDAFLADHSMTDHRFGLLAAHNGRLVERLRSGGRVWPETEALVRDFIRSETLRRSENQNRAA